MPGSVWSCLVSIHRTDSQSRFNTVRVPKGSSAGQTILVKHPSGNNQVVSTVIPEGHYPGSTFYVRFPPAPGVSGIPASNPQTSGKQANHASQSPNQPRHPSDASVSGFGSVISQSHGNPPNRNAKHETKKHKRCSEEMLLLHNKGLVKVRVPPNLKPGDKMRVQIPDGRIIDTVVPPGNLSEFHVKVPAKKQNFHDNPVAVHAPMLLGPLFM
jgi:hypothetical protein